MRAEAKVGILVVIALIGLFVLSAQISGAVSWGKKGYELFSAVNSASGLEANAKVKISGVEVGYVKNIGLQNNKPYLTLFIYEGVTIPDDSVIEVTQESMLGLKFVQIIPGNSAALLANGGSIANENKVADFTQAANSINEAASEFAGFIKDLRATLNPETRQNIQKAIADFDQMAINMSNMGSEFTQTGKDVNKRLPEIMDRFTALEKDIQELIKDNKKPLNNALNSVDTFFKNGNDTLQKVDDYITRQTSGELTVYMNAGKYTNYNGGLFMFGADYSPSPTNHYIIGMETTPNFTMTNQNGQYMQAPPHTKSVNYIDAMYGKRMSDFRVRGGLIQSTGGVGVDYYAINDKLKASVDLFDFGAVNDIRGTNPHARALVSYRLLKYIEVIGGADNFLNSKAATGIIGIGLRFKDEDLKYLVGGSGSSFIR